MTNNERFAARREKKQQKLDSGLISEHFPEVSSIVINMTNSYGGINPITVSRTLNFCTNSYAYFNVECLSKDCLDGGFDLNQVITMMIRSHQGLREGELVCDGDNLYPNHSHIYYNVTIQYK